MQLNDMLEHRNKIIDAFKSSTFLSEYLKKSDNAAYGYVLKVVKNFIQEIKLMEEKINLSLFEDFLESSSPADYAKKLIASSDKNKEFAEEIKDRISDLKERIKKLSETEKKNNAYETLEIIEKILDYSKNTPKYFQLASKVDKEKSEPKQKSDRSIPGCRCQKIDFILQCLRLTKTKI